MHFIVKHFVILYAKSFIEIKITYLLLVHVFMFSFPTVYFSGVKLHVASAQDSVFAVRGDDVTLPCRFWYQPHLSSPREVRVKWSWVPAAGGQEMDVLVAISPHSQSFGEFRWLKKYT